MRQTRSFPTALLLGLVTVAVLGGCSADGGSAPGEAPATPSSLATPADSTGTGGDPSATTSPPAPETTGPGAPPAGEPSPADAKQAEATAAFFMRTEIGMRDPVTRPFRATGQGTGEVVIYPGSGSESGGPVPNLVTTVSLRRRPGGWEVTGTRSPNILVSRPTTGARIASPVRLAGMAFTFEGNVEVEVRDNRNGKDQTLGQGVVTGGGDQLRPFSGSVTFRRSSTPSGWVVFMARSAVDGQVLEATAVRIGFAR
jgi:hypothetical protein